MFKTGGCTIHCQADQVSRGRSNKLVGQVAEHLVVAELGRRGFIATGFAGNVPAFDVIAADEYCRTVPIQVKASSGDSWPSDARTFMRIDYDSNEKRQNYLGPVALRTPDLIYVFVALRPTSASRPTGRSEVTDRDRFFVLTMNQLQQVCINCYAQWMDPKDWRRPRSPESYDNRFWIRHLEAFEDQWQLIEERLRSRPPDPSLATSAAAGNS